MNRRYFLTGVCVATMSAICSSIFPKNYELDPTLSEEEGKVLSEWYKRVLINSGRTSCCGLGDAYWADDLEIVSGQDYFFATITDDRDVPNRVNLNGKKIKVPYTKLDQRRQGNPTGHNIIFVNPHYTGEENNKDYMEDETDVSIYCFFPGQGN